MIHCKLCMEECALKRSFSVGEKIIERYQCKCCILPDIKDPIDSKEYSLYYLQLLNRKFFTEEIIFSDYNKVYGVLNNYIPIYGNPETYVYTSDVYEKRLYPSIGVYLPLFNLNNISSDILLTKIKTVLTFH